VTSCDGPATENKPLRLERDILSKGKQGQRTIRWIVRPTSAWFARDTTGCRSGLRVHDRETCAFPVKAMCEAFGVSRSGFHAWRDRRPCGRALGVALLAKRITAIHAASRQTHGARAKGPR